MVTRFRRPMALRNVHGYLFYRVASLLNPAERSSFLLIIQKNKRSTLVSTISKYDDKRTKQKKYR